MILHLVSDHYVTNTCLKIFREELPGQNIVLVYNHFGYSVEGDEIVTDDNAAAIARQIDFSKITCVVISFMTGKKRQFVERFVPFGIPVIWWTYGMDFYVGYLEKRGYQVFYSPPDKYRFGGVLTMPLLNLFRFFQNRGIRNEQDRFMADRLSGFVPCIRPEYDLLPDIKKKVRLIQIHPYGSSFKFDGRFTEGNDISLGHSASISDNHLYALKYLNRLDIGESQLYLTLSYSNKVPRYTQAVRRHFRKRYGGQVHFIDTLMDKQTYFESQFRYKMMILPSWRQEALDNIYTCLQIGIKLVLSEKSVVYRYLKEYGFFVFSLEHLTQDDLATPLNRETMQHNQLLFEKFVEERKRNYYADFQKYFKTPELSDGQQ
jgi:hypothetical protein